MTGRSSIWAPAPGPDRSRKLHETIAPSNHRSPFLAVRSSRPAWLLMGRGPRRLPRGQISCHFGGSSYFFCSALRRPFIRHVGFLCWGWFYLGLWLHFWPPFLLFLTRTYADVKLRTQKPWLTFTNFRFPVLSGVPIVPAKQITLRLIYVLINPVVTFQPAEHKLYND